MKNQTNTLNAYQIKWSIVKLDSKITKKIAAKASKLGYSVMSGALVRHSAKEEILTQEESKLISLLKFERKSGIAVIITDKQFGMTTISYNGAANLNVNLNNAIVLEEGQRVTVVPVTTEQLKHSVKF